MSLVLSCRRLLPSAFTDTPGSARAWQYTDEAVLKLAEIADQISDTSLREYIETRAAGAKLRRTAAQLAADQKRSEIEQARRAQAAREAARHAEASEKLDRELIRQLRDANPAISKSEIEALLPEMRKRRFLDVAERAKQAMCREMSDAF